MTDSELLSAFRHDPDGNWVCVKPFLLNGPERNLAIVPGTSISETDILIGCHLVRQLDEAAARQKH
jgi:hypothetical protein